MVAVVAAVGPEVAPRSGLLAERLVNPVPDEAAVEVGPRLQNVPVLLQVPRAVAERVRVLDEVEGFALALLLPVAHEVLRLRVHRVEGVAVDRGAGLVD